MGSISWGNYWFDSQSCTSSCVGSLTFQSPMRSVYTCSCSRLCLSTQPVPVVPPPGLPASHLATQIPPSPPSSPVVLDLASTPTPLDASYPGLERTLQQSFSSPNPLYIPASINASREESKILFASACWLVASFLLQTQT